jgi:hypothetical protein
VEWIRGDDSFQGAKTTEEWSCTFAYNQSELEGHRCYSSAFLCILRNLLEGLRTSVNIVKWPDCPTKERAWSAVLSLDLYVLYIHTFNNTYDGKCKYYVHSDSSLSNYRPDPPSEMESHRDKMVSLTVSNICSLATDRARHGDRQTERLTDWPTASSNINLTLT